MGSENEAQQSVDAVCRVLLNHRTMRPDLEALLILQDRDQKIKALQTQQKNLPREKKSLEDKVASARVVLDHAKQRMKENEVARRNLQLEVEGKQGSIARFKTQQQATRKNEEFQAFNHEIKHFEDDIRGLEDRELELMEQGEQLQNVFVSADKEFKKTETTIREQLARIESGAGAVESRLQELLADRSKQAASIEENLAELYQRLFTKKGDAAVVPLEHEVCGGCHMKVPNQTSADVRTESKIAQCPQCGRILYRVL